MPFNLFLITASSRYIAFIILSLIKPHSEVVFSINYSLNLSHLKSSFPPMFSKNTLSIASHIHYTIMQCIIFICILIHFLCETISLFRVFMFYLSFCCKGIWTELMSCSFLHLDFSLSHQIAKPYHFGGGYTEFLGFLALVFSSNLENVQLLLQFFLLLLPPFSRDCK